MHKSEFTLMVFQILKYQPDNQPTAPCQQCCPEMAADLFAVSALLNCIPENLVVMQLDGAGSSGEYKQLQETLDMVASQSKRVSEHHPRTCQNHFERYHFQGEFGAGEWFVVHTPGGSYHIFEASPGEMVYSLGFALQPKEAAELGRILPPHIQKKLQA